MGRFWLIIRSQFFTVAALATLVILPLLWPNIVRYFASEIHAPPSSGLRRQDDSGGRNAAAAWRDYAREIGLVVVNLGLIVFIGCRNRSDRRIETLRMVQEQNRLLRRANRELAAVAERDGLTGLLNHLTFQAKLASEFSFATRESSPLSLLIVDVDHFKSFNDRFGHQTGDAVLARVGRILREVARGSDIVARYGGEEFAVLLPETSERAAYEVAERIRRRIETGAGHNVPVTVSIGVAMTFGDVPTSADLIAAADGAMYQSKERGRNRVTIAGEGAAQRRREGARADGVAA